MPFALRAEIDELHYAPEVKAWNFTDLSAS